MNISTLRLHVPDEPTEKLSEWRKSVEKGASGDEVILGPIQDIHAESPKMEPVVVWLWSRWQHLKSVGVTENEFLSIASGAKRELWLWIAGERTWTSVCSAIAGRVQRRLP